MITLLEPIFRGPFAPHGETLHLVQAPPSNAIAVAQLLGSPGILQDVLQRRSQYLGYTGKDHRPLASAWSMAYLAALLPPVCAAATLLRHVFPIEASNTWVELHEDGLPQSFYILSLGQSMPDADVWQRYQRLVWGHLVPLVDALHPLTRLPRKILWANVVRYFDGVFDAAQALAGSHPDLRADRDALLGHLRWGIAGSPCQAFDTPFPANPLFGTDRVITILRDGIGETVKLHRQCCLLYKLSPKHGYCGACPLDPRYRSKSLPLPPD